MQLLQGVALISRHTPVFGVGRKRGRRNITPTKTIKQNREIPHQQKQSEQNGERRMREHDEREGVRGTGKIKSKGTNLEISELNLDSTIISNIRKSSA